MNAKKPSPGDAGHAEETRKVDAMSELVAGMLLDDPDATSPPPDASPGSLSAVRPTSPRSSSRPIAHAMIAEQPRRPRIARLLVIVLVIAIAMALVAVLAAVLFSS
jgi:hypothetical protein